MANRSYGRTTEQNRPLVIEPGVSKYAEGSVLISTGDTKVLCTCSVEERVPGFLKDSGEGWVTAEYSMLPRATHTRSDRERKKLGGRTMEIQRLIGRSLRAIIDRKKIEGYTMTIDCDVIQADGGTRTASISGGFVALALACKRLKEEGKISENPLFDSVGAVSLGILDDIVHLDLDYEEDYAADVDLNLVMTGSGSIIEVQGTAEGKSFSQAQLNKMLELGSQGIEHIGKYQRLCVESGEKVEG